MSMPELTVDASVAIDLASKEDIEQHHRWLEARLARPKALTDSQNSSVLLATLPILLVFPNRPASGRLWNINWVSVFLDSVVPPVASVAAELCIGGVATTTPNLGAPVASGLTVPGYADLRHRIARANQLIYLVIGGSGSITGTVNVNATIGYFDWPDTEETVALL